MMSQLGAVVAGENMWKSLGEQEKTTIIHKPDSICLLAKIYKIAEVATCVELRTKLEAGTVVEKDACLVENMSAQDCHILGDARLK